jgi:hypothetical protein
VDAINRTDLDLRKSLFGNIVLSGGSTLTKGFGDRLLHEVQRLAVKDMRIKIFAPPERKYSTWIGGSILAGLSTFRKVRPPILTPYCLSSPTNNPIRCGSASMTGTRTRISSIPNSHSRPSAPPQLFNFISFLLPPSQKSPRPRRPTASSRAGDALPSPKPVVICQPGPACPPPESSSRQPTNPPAPVLKLLHLSPSIFITCFAACAVFQAVQHFSGVGTRRVVNRVPVLPRSEERPRNGLDWNVIDVCVCVCVCYNLGGLL